MRGPWNSIANLLDEALMGRIDYDTLAFMKKQQRENGLITRKG